MLQASNATIFLRGISSLSFSAKKAQAEICLCFFLLRKERVEPSAGTARGEPTKRCLRQMKRGGEVKK